MIVTDDEGWLFYRGLENSLRVLTELLLTIPALKNVALPMLYGGVPRSERSRRASELLQLVEMSGRSHHRPNELSGGQKQRVAIARAMANDPAIILADEPTGALDSHTGRLVMDIFHRLHQEQGKTIILITHNAELAEETERTIRLRDGSIVDNRMNNQYQLEGCYESV